MNDKEILENIVREIANSFSGDKSTKDWTGETIWFDASPFACVGRNHAKKVFDESFGALNSCQVEIQDIRTRILGNAGIVCSVQKWNLDFKNGNKMSLMMRQTNYFEKINDIWKVLHEHTSAVDNWDGKIIE